MNTDERTADAEGEHQPIKVMEGEHQPIKVMGKVRNSGSCNQYPISDHQLLH